MVFRSFGLFLFFLLSFSCEIEAREIRTASEALRLADTAFLNEQYEKSEDYYRRAIELAPKQAVLAIRLGQLFYTQSRYTEAEQIFEEADALKKDRLTQRFLTTVIQKMKEEKTLLEQIETALRNNETGILRGLHEQAARRLGRSPALMALVAPHWEYLLKTNPKNPAVLRSLAEGYFSSSDPAKAFIYYKKLTKESPPDPGLYRRFGDTAVNVGAYDEARLAYKKALRAAVRSRRADERLDLKKMIHALPAFSDRIDALIRDEEYAAAFRELRKCLARNPSHPWAVVQMGRIYEELGRLGQAERLYLKAIQWRYEDPSAHYALGRFYLYKKKKFEKALEEFKLFRVLLNENLTLTMDESLQKKLIEHWRDSTRSIAYLYLEILGQPKNAVTELQHLTQRGVAEAKDYYNLGVAYWRMQRRNDAYQALKKVIQIDPKSEVAKDAQQLIDSIRSISKEGFEVELGGDR